MTIPAVLPRGRDAHRAEARAAIERTGRVVGRYELFDAFASGGMATVHFARLRGEAGFTRTVAIKRLHPSYADDPAIVSTLLDEARLASRVQHPHVVATLDVVVDGAEIVLVLEYVHGESLSRLLRAAGGNPPDVSVVTAILSGALHGLHAAHEARSASGEPLGIVHRDVSPQNILVGVDGLARVLDFGIAKARGRLQTTREGQVKGKLAYMAPEQLRRGNVTPATDVFAAGVVLWEALTASRLFAGDSEGEVVLSVLERPIPAPSSLRADVSPELDAVVLRALARDPEQRFRSARELALALEEHGRPASPTVVGGWVESVARDELSARAARLDDIEAFASDSPARSASADAVTRTDLAAIDGADRTKTEVSAVTSRRASAAASERGGRAARVGASLAFGALLLGAGFVVAQRSASVETVETSPPAAAPGPSSAEPSSPAASAPAERRSASAETPAAAAAPTEAPTASARAPTTSPASAAAKPPPRGSAPSPKPSSAPPVPSSSPRAKFYRFP